MTKFVFGILFAVFFVAAHQGIPQALGQDECSDIQCSSDVDCTADRPSCNQDEGVCEALQNACQSDADCTDPCMSICDIATLECVEDGCSSLEGAAYGLCNAYCEAMDCDGEPKASEKACDKVLVNYQKKTDILMPCSDPCLDTECRQGEMCVDGECLCGDNQCIGDELCVGGVCQPVVCDPGFADCSGNGQCDTDLSNDDANCGECGFSCNIFEACSGGACLPIQCTIGGVCPLGTFCQTGVCVLIPQ